METLHKYVPTKASEGQLHLPNGSTLPYDNTAFFEILFGGDQLTVARAAGVQDLRKGHEMALERLEGLTPVVEDWHTRVILLEVSGTNFTKFLCCSVCALTQLQDKVMYMYFIITHY